MVIIPYFDSQIKALGCYSGVRNQKLGARIDDKRIRQIDSDQFSQIAIYVPFLLGFITK